MATYTFYDVVNSQTDGSKGAQITSGQVGIILPELTSQDRVSGVTRLEKFYFQSDTSQDVFFGLSDNGDFDTRIIDSTGTAEVAGDVAGSRRRYGCAEIVSNSATGCVIKHNPNVDLFQAGDFILVGDIVAKINTITANNADRTIDYVSDIPYTDQVGTKAVSVIKKSISANDGVPVWIEEVVPAGASASQTYTTMGFKIVS